MRWQLKLNLFQFTHSFLTVVLPTIIIANDVLSGELEVGRAVQAGGAFASVMVALTIIVDHFEGLSRFSAGVERLFSFSEALDAQAANALATDQPQGITTTAGTVVAFNHLTVCTPNGEQTLIHGLDLSIAPGQGLMIVGASGVGKSSLLRVTAGLWSTGAGEVVRPFGEDLLFLPQQPYLPLGDLRCQLTYPQQGIDISDDDILDCLNQVNLSSLADRVGGLDAEKDWGKLLSVGEQQRLSFARALLLKPRYLLLDESTSALDSKNEALLYAQLSRLSITPISVSHHSSLLRYHGFVLVMEGEGKWSLHAADKFTFG